MADTFGDASLFAELIVADLVDVATSFDSGTYSPSAVIGTTAPDVLARVACSTGAAAGGQALCLPADLPEAGAPVMLPDQSEELDSTVDDGAFQVGDIALGSIGGSSGPWFFPFSRGDGPAPSELEVSGMLGSESFSHSMQMPQLLDITGDDVEWDTDAVGSVYVIAGGQMELLEGGAATLPTGWTWLLSLTVDESVYGEAWIRTIGMRLYRLDEG
ncbi:MAG: hypothetical protein AAGA54_20025 [Myxococcota bacterium]